MVTHKTRSGAPIAVGEILMYYADTGCMGMAPVLVRVECVTRCFAQLTDEFGNRARRGIDWCQRELRSPSKDFLAEAVVKFAEVGSTT